MNSKASVWEFADVASAMLDRSQALGVNQYVNRIAAGRYPLAFANNADGSELLRNLEKRLAADPAGVAPQKVGFRFRARACPRRVRRARHPRVAALGGHGCGIAHRYFHGLRRRA